MLTIAKEKQNINRWSVSLAESAGDEDKETWRRKLDNPDHRCIKNSDQSIYISVTVVMVAHALFNMKTWTQKFTSDGDEFELILPYVSQAKIALV